MDEREKAAQSGLFLSSMIPRQRGFTMVELIMVVVLLGILAIVAIPRLSTKDFDARGFHDATLALLRFAQKTAIAQRRTVCVAFTTTSATLSEATLAGNNTCGGSLAGPNGQTPGQVIAATGVGYQTVPGGAFFFNSLGQPSQPLSLQVTQAGSSIGLTISVETETGYVHD